MKRFDFLFLAIFAHVFVMDNVSIACTAVCLNDNDNIVIGKNYDWMVEEGEIIVNKRGVEKQSINYFNAPSDIPASWISKYGSVTFNQYGREVSLGGMNEVGLVVEALALKETRFPEKDSRPSVMQLQWVQYQLDMAESVEQVIGSVAKLRIRSSRFGNHFFVCDRTGSCCIIEFINGQSVIHTGKKVSIKLLTNAPYVQLVKDLKAQKHDKKDPWRSQLRFNFAAAEMKRQQAKPINSAVTSAFEVLSAAHSKKMTQWSIVYEPKNGRIHFKTKREPAIRVLNFAALDFSCTSPVKVLDIHMKGAGDISNRFSDYSLERNRNLIAASVAKTPFLNDMSQAAIDYRAAYPDTTICRPD